MKSPLKAALNRILLAALALVCVQAPAAAQDTWRLHLEDVEVVRQREASGDRPYFAIIQFRSRFGMRGSTQVSVNVPEPHDWVSKPGLRGSLPVGDHMMSGQRTQLPFWTRDTEWRNVTLLPSPFVSGTIDGPRLSAALNAEVIGYAIIGLDNNNTPPHVIQGLLDTIGNVLAQTLRETVEPVLASSATSAAFRTNLETTLQRTAQRAIRFSQVVDVAGQLTVGSSFNPDQLTGVQVRLMPAVQGLPFDPSTAIVDQRIDLPSIVTAGPIQAHSVTQSLNSWVETLDFTGSGAQYRVRASMSPAACGSDMISTLTVNLLSGDDGLRDNNDLQLELSVAGRTPVVLPLGSGDGDRRNNTFTRTVTLRTPVPRSALQGAGLRVTQRFSFPETADNWTLNALQVSSPGGVIVAQTGRPLMRFTGEAGRFMLDTRCGPSAPAVTDPLVNGLRITLRTGGDDLRGGNDNAFVFVNIAGRGRVEVPFNGGARLPDRSSHTIVLPLPGGVPLSQLRSFGVRATLGGGIGGDNWNIDGANVIANLMGGGSRTLLDQNGSPVVRLTGDLREMLWELRP